MATVLCDLWVVFSPAELNMLNTTFQFEYVIWNPMQGFQFEHKVVFWIITHVMCLF